MLRFVVVVVGGWMLKRKNGRWTEVAQGAGKVGMDKVERERERRMRGIVCVRRRSKMERLALFAVLGDGGFGGLSELVGDDGLGLDVEAATHGVWTPHLCEAKVLASSCHGNVDLLAE